MKLLKRVVALAVFSAGILVLASPAQADSPFAHCKDAYAAGYWNIPSSSPYYAPRLDADKDGTGCESPGSAGYKQENLRDLTANPLPAQTQPPKTASPTSPTAPSVEAPAPPQLASTGPGAPTGTLTIVGVGLLLAGFASMKLVCKSVAYAGRHRG